MEIPAVIVIISVIQLLFFIISVYIMVYLHLGRRHPLSVSEVLLAVMQAAMLVFLIKYFTGQISIISTVAEGEILLYSAQGILILLLFIRYARLLNRVLSSQRDSLTPQSIRETIDHMPGGICFAATNGRPILTNLRMNELIFTLTNRTIINVHKVWEDLVRADFTNGCKKAGMPPMQPGNDYDSADDSVFVALPNNSIWRFSKTLLTDSEPYYIQLEAAEITELYYLSNELFDNNARLAEQNERQRNLFANIVDINQEKEILSTKMKIHDDFGRSILTTRQHLANGTVKENITELVNVWMNAVKNMEDYAHIDTDSESSPEIELRKAAEMIGCHIDFIGDRPVNRKTALLFYAAVREALTNAVVHAKADRLIVSIRPCEHGYHVEILDNGISQVSSLTEGNGLSNLRRRLEQEGATLHIKCDDGVVMIIELPYTSTQDATAQ